MNRLSKSALGLAIWLTALDVLACTGQPLEEVTPSAMQEPVQEEPVQEEPEQEEPEQEAAKTFAVYILSRGKGVPPEAREVMRRAQELVDRDREAGVAVRTERTRLGLEGETRLCIDYEDPTAADKAFRQIEEMTEGVDLVNLVAEPCMKDSEKPESGTQKED